MIETRGPGGRRTVSAVLGLVIALMLATAGPVDAHRRAAFPVESLGSRGVNVTAVQHLLRANGWLVRVDSTFGESTQAAVAAFQDVRGLRVSGAVDEPTWRELVPDLADGAVSEAVVAVQKLLNAKVSAGLTITGSYDGDTSAEVRRFQRRMAIDDTGLMDRATWRNLLWHYVYPDFRNTSMCDYHSGNGKAANWGTAATVGQLEAAAALFKKRTGLNVSVGELSFRHGGRIAGHSTHRVGLDVDFGLIRKDGRHCRRLGLSYTQAQYDRQMTRELINAIYETAPGRVKLIYFNDPVLIREGLVVRYPNHHHHLHVRYCEADHPQSRYRCDTPKLPSLAERQALLDALPRRDLNGHGGPATLLGRSHTLRPL